MNKGWLRHLDFTIIDIVSIELALTISFLLTGNFDIIGDEFWPFYLFLPFLHLSMFILLDTYNGILQRGYIKEFISLFQLEFCIASILIFFCYYLEINIQNMKGIFISYFAICFPLTYIFRFIHKFYLKHRYSKVKYCRQILIVASETAAKHMIKTITESAIRNYQFFGLIVTDKNMKGQEIDGVLVSENIDGLINYIRTQIVDEVFINIPTDSALTLKLAKQLLQIGVTVHIYMEDDYQTLPNRQIGNVFGYNVLTSTISPISFRQSLGKRLMDIIGGLTGFTLAIIIGIIIGPIIFIKSPGPILFSQTRVGKQGREFKFYKFRSMYVNAEEQKEKLMKQNVITNQLMFKIPNDPRIISGIGHFIRKTSLDEFPQFWNVLKGDMSLVGTRPPTIDEYRRYSPHHKKRLSMRPGLTGLWQVSGRSTITDFEEIVKLDTQYIENWSFSLDIKIIFKTLVKMWRNYESY